MFVVVLDRGISESQPLVKSYRPLGAPVPLVLVGSIIPAWRAARIEPFANMQVV